MESSVKRLTEAAILSAAFVVLTIFALATGIGYSIYLDFGVPIIFTLIYFRCDLKYTVLSGITSIIIILFVLGNFAAGILVSQGFVLGVICGYLLSKISGIFDDLFLGAVCGVLFMVLIDIYAKNIIGFSFMDEFKGYIDYITQKQPELIKIFPYIKYLNLEVLYYLLIATFPFGMVFSVYFISLICGKKLRLLNSNCKRKYFMIRSIKNYGAFMNMRIDIFYTAVIYIIIANIFNMMNISFSGTYLKTITTSIEYLCYYFVIRDSHLIIGNYINARFRKTSINYIYLIIAIILLVNYFKITVTAYIIISTIMDKKLKSRLKHRYIVDTHTNKLMEAYKI